MPRLAVAQTVCQVGDVAANLEQGETLVAQDRAPKWREAAAPYLSDRKVFSWQGC